MSVFRTLKIFVMGPDPRSLKSIELLNWTGLAFIGRRDQISEARARREMKEPGVYMLIGSDDVRDGLVDVYIGETDDFSRRISDHVGAKGWWDTFVVFVSKDRFLTKAHVKWLEKQLFLTSKKAVGTINVRNEKEPNGAALPESDEHAVKEFYNNLIFVLETLGYSYFESANRKQKTSTEEADANVFQITLPKDVGTGNLKSQLEVSNGSFILLQGSYIRANQRDSFASHKSYYAIWKKIIESDAVKLTEMPGVMQTTRDIEFKSPSAAGAIVRGASTNGRTDWKRIKDGKSFSDCFSDELAQGESLT